MRRVTKCLAAGAALVSTVLLGAGTAVAAPRWQPVSGPFHSCGQSVAHSVPGVRFQGCLVVSSLGKAQVVLVANNFSGKPVQFAATILSNFTDDDWPDESNVSNCWEETVPNATQRACYAPSEWVKDCYSYPGDALNGGPWGGEVRLTANGVTDDTYSSRVCLKHDNDPFD
ncbi:hypothetical protein [Streptomyces sp. ODS05-4]|uniref:hypothetical protein n=1 Tax=Streptomyces sp. ODS05-4 TaxID=2944939 RepID=UPI00210A9FCE|nr:hypothetical protein [Streptomyces sp. ODS05-4]